MKANPADAVKQRTVRFDCSVTSRGGAKVKILKEDEHFNIWGKRGSKKG